MSELKAININKKMVEVFKRRRDKYGFIQIDDDLIDKVAHDCGLSAGFLYIKLLKHLNFKTGICNISIRTIAQDLNISDKTVSNNLKKLKESGYIEWGQKKSKNNNYMVNYYCFKNAFSKDIDETEIDCNNDSDKTASEEVKEEVKEEVEEVPEEVEEEVEEAKEEDKIYNNVKKMVGELNKFQKNINDSYKKVTLNGYIININKFFKMNNENSIKWTLEEINNYLCAIDKRNKRSPIPGMPGKRVTPIIAGINDFNAFKEVLNINKDL